MSNTCTINDCERHAISRSWCRTHYQRWKRHGDPLALKKKGRPPVDHRCSIEGCDRPFYGKGFCQMHWMRFQRTGDTGPAGLMLGFVRGEDHWCWKGENITYDSAHSRVEALFGIASEWSCAVCAVPAEHWAYNHQSINEQVSPEGWPYSANPEDYIPLCQSCHKTFDWSYIKEQERV